MPTARMQVVLNTSPAEVWAVVGPFDSIATWHPAISKAVLSADGKRRTITLPDGSESTEELVTYDAEAMQYRYKIVTLAPPLASFLATFTVMGLGGKTLLTWEADFDPTPGAPADKVKQMLEHIFNACVPALQARFNH